MKLFPATKPESQKGQAILIVLLIFSVVLVIGLSIASRSVTDVKISQQAEESARVFWVAQAGLERAIKASESVPSSSLNNIQYSVTKTNLGGGNTFIFNENTLGKVAVDDNRIFWLLPHNSDGSINSGAASYNGNVTICWGESGDNPPSVNSPAIEITLLYDNNGSGDYRFQRFLYDPLPSPRSPDNNFSKANLSCPSPGLSGFQFSTDPINMPAGSKPYFLWIKLLYMDSSRQTSVGIYGTAAFTGIDQGLCFESTATMSPSNIVRKLKECRSWPTPPSIFSYVLFSGTGGIVK